jgi:peptidylprolyl isomerase
MTALHSRRSTLLLASSALIASLGLTACGGGGSSDAGTPVNSDPNGWNQVTTLQTTDTVVGTGTPMGEGTIAAVAYTGWLYDGRNANHKGTQIDTNVGSTPMSFIVNVNTLIKGFDQGVVGMKPGGKRTVTIPASLAYGAAGKSPSVPANAALVFDIELDPNGWAAVTTLKTTDTLDSAGALAGPGSTVSVTYTGWIYDVHATDTKGAKFDSNVGGKAFTFKLGDGSTITGFNDGIVGMHVGGKRTITIPYRQAYGSQGQGTIPGGAPLVFDVELTAVN